MVAAKVPALGRFEGTTVSEMSAMKYRFHRSFANTPAGRWLAYKESAWMRKKGYNARVVRPTRGPLWYIVEISDRKRGRK